MLEKDSQDFYDKFVSYLQSISDAELQTDQLQLFNKFTIQLNKDLELGNQVYLQKYFDEFNEDIEKIKTKSFAWDTEKAAKYKSFFENLSLIHQPLLIKFGNLDFILKRFPPFYF